MHECFNFLGNGVFDIHNMSCCRCKAKARMLVGHYDDKYDVPMCEDCLRLLAIKMETHLANAQATGMLVLN